MNTKDANNHWSEILGRIADSAPYRYLLEEVLAARSASITGVQGSLMAGIAGLLRRDSARQCLLIVRDDDAAEELRDDAALLLGEEHVQLLGHGMGRKAKLLDMSFSIAQSETLNALAERRDILVVASARSAATRLPTQETFSGRIFEIRKGEESEFENLPARLDALGFERKEFVEEYGDYAVRGGILDIFPFIGTQPIRVEFWGDSVESIREFDVVSQRSIRNLEAASIVAKLEDDTSHTVTVLDYMRPGAFVILDEPALLRKEAEAAGIEGAQGLADWTELEETVKGLPTITHTLLSSSGSSVPTDFQSVSQPSFGGSTKRFLADISDLSAGEYRVFVGSDSADEARRLAELLEEESRPDGQGEETMDERRQKGTELSLPYHPVAESIHRGFIFRPGRMAVYAEHELFGRLRRRGPRTKRTPKGLSPKELQQLQRGDYVVHHDYGIGKFSGLQKIRVRNVDQEVMKLVYEGGDAIYVNLNFVDRVHKYSSREGHVPALSRLGTQEWDRLKARVRKKVKDIARDLIKLYARRKHEAGHGFAPDTHWQKEMEASFMYEDTPDQASATLAVKKDMESTSPMDRLICGDVGFGKTEVAVRASFKAVMDGKQVAILVPTTILARQHLLTFLDRVGRYGVRVESLSRLKSRKEQAEVLRGVREGRVDVLIGTHRVLSKDVSFKDLGLLVVDEEHRFGVSAKEKLRQLRANVDTLTLTATPIPRTLHFSLMGARDLSLIATPPLNRLPILTEIVPFDKGLMREAIVHEVRRGGQVYFIHDRIHDMEEIRRMVEQLVPEARVAVAHGQMDGKALEGVVMNFLDRKFDVLVCTKIIESGIDIPSVNTILVNRADRFGLAELYQLRGRVGRSNVQAFAYLLTPPIESLPRQAIRRLQALREFTELGSGFNLAMRDLEIRGAGNLLGAEQSGFILDMGFDLYQRVVAEAVGELREEEFADLFPAPKGVTARNAVQTIVESDVPALIPDVYVESDAERLDLYRRLYALGSVDEVGTFRTELRDRFGEHPPEVANLLTLLEIKVVAGRLAMKAVELSGDRLILTLAEKSNGEFYEPVDGRLSPFQRLMDAVVGDKQLRGRLQQQADALRLEMRLGGPNDDGERLQSARGLMQRLCVAALGTEDNAPGLDNTVH